MTSIHMEKTTCFLTPFCTPRIKLMQQLNDVRINSGNVAVIAAVVLALMYAVNNTYLVLTLV